MMLMSKTRNGQIVVVDVVTLSIWIPDDLMAAAIERAPHPFDFAVSMCRLHGNRGSWETR